MVRAMSRPSRKFLPYGAAAASFACGVAMLATGWPAGFAWTLIVVSLACAAQCARGRGAPAPRRVAAIAARSSPGTRS